MMAWWLRGKVTHGSSLSNQPLVLSDEWAGCLSTRPSERGQTSLGCVGAMTGLYRRMALIMEWKVLL